MKLHKVAVKLHSFFFFQNGCVGGQVGGEIGQAHQVAVKLHKLLFFFFEMVSSGRVWEVPRVALKLHISCFFFFFPNCCAPGCGEIAHSLFFLKNGCVGPRW